MVVQLGLTGPDADDAHFQLKSCINDVLVTRNWTSHFRILSVTQVVRAMTSLVGTISKIGCDPVPAQCASSVIAACIADVHACHNPSSSVTLTVSSLTFVFFNRALQRLCKAINVSDISKDTLCSRWPNRNQDIRIAIDCVWNGKCYLLHGKCYRKSMALLVSMCAVSRLLRSLGDKCTDDANACDADIMHLLARMQLCDGPQLLQAVYDCHRET